MAQRNYFRSPQTAIGTELDIIQTAGAFQLDLTATTTTGGTELQMGMAGTPLAFKTRLLAADLALSGTIPFRHWSYAPTASNATIRVTLSTVSSAGVVTALGQADAGVLPTAATLQSLSVPVITTDVGRHQRIFAHVYAVPVSGQTMVAGHEVTSPFNNAASSTGDAALDLPDGTTWYPNKIDTTLRARRTSANGIGVFLDLLEPLGTTVATTGVVNTVASGTEIQWTQTAGGALLEWISPRLRFGGTLDDDIAAGTTIRVLMTGRESATAANCSHRVKLFRWRKGVETQFLTWDHPTEFTTTLAERTTGSGIPFTDTPFIPDDRIILRFYIIPIGTMGGARTCTVSYDTDTPGSSETRVEFVKHDLIFKDESEPDDAPSANQMMSGVGN